MTSDLEFDLVRRFVALYPAGYTMVPISTQSVNVNRASILDQCRQQLVGGADENDLGKWCVCV